MILATVLTLGGIIALLGARGYRQRLRVLATAVAIPLAEALDGEHEPPVTLRARTLRDGYQQLQAPASGRACIWWGLLIRAHKRSTAIMLDDIGGRLKAFSPHPFHLTDGARTVRVDPQELVTYGHPHSARVSERLRRWDHTPPVTERVRRLLPDLARAAESGTRRLDYTEWLIEEDEEVTITGRLDSDPETGDAVLRAYNPPGHLKPIFHLTPSADHTDVTELRRRHRRDIAAGYLFLFVGGTCLLSAVASILISIYN